MSFPVDLLALLAYSPRYAAGSFVAGLIFLSGGRQPAVLSPDNWIEAHYRLDFASTGKANLGALSAKKTPDLLFETKFRGDLELVGRAGSSTLLAVLKPREVSIVQDGRELAAASATTKAEIDRPFLVSFYPNGNIGACRFSQPTSPGSKQILLSLMAYLQHCAPNLASSDRSEATPAGIFPFNYRRLKTDGHVSIYRKAPDAVPQTSASSLSPLTSLAGKLQIVVDHAVSLCQVRSVDGEIDQKTQWQGAEVSRSQNRISLTLVSQGKFLGDRAVFESIYASLSKAEPSSVYTVRSPRSIQNDVERHQLGDSTTADVIGSLKTLGDRPEGSQDLTSVYLKLYSLVYIHPESVESLRPLFSPSGPDSAVFQLIDRALGAVGNDACQQFLSEAIQDRSGDSRTAERLLATLSRLKLPNSKTVRFTQELSGRADKPSVRRVSIMVLGAFARNLALADPQRSRSIGEDLLKRLEQSTNSGEQKLFLGALGNVGSSCTFEACLKFLGSPDETIRAQAASALRFVQLPVVDDLLLHILQADPSAESRYNAAEAASFRTMNDALIAGLEASLDDPSREVRSTVMTVLWRNHNLFPSVKRAIQKVAEGDPDKDLRDQAKKLLE